MICVLQKCKCGIVGPSPENVWNETKNREMKDL